MAPQFDRPTRPTNELPTPPPPQDGKPVRELANANGVGNRTIRSWREWETHPALGRPLRYGVGEFIVTTRSGQRRRRKGLLVSRADVKKCVESDRPTSHMRKPPTTIPPRDAEPVKGLVIELGVHDRTLREWCEWETHPALGRPLRCGVGRFVVTARDGQRRHRKGLLVSRADATECVAALKSPLYRRFPGTPGVWIASGVFRHDDGRLFFSERYVYRNQAKFGMPKGTLHLSVYRKRLEVLTVFWPGVRERWIKDVLSEASLIRLAERREGRVDGGCWLVPNEIWRDADGLWFSSRHLAQKAGKPVKHMDSMLRRIKLRDRVKRFKKVPLIRPGGGETVVHHESESRVRDLLGLGGPPADDGCGAVLPGQVAILAPGQDAARPPAADPLPASEPSQSPTRKTKNKGGRPLIGDAGKVHRLCYDRYVHGDKLAVILSEARRLYPKSAPKQAGHVAQIARRYAKKHNLPLNRPGSG